MPLPFYNAEICFSISLAILFWKLFLCIIYRYSQVLMPVGNERERASRINGWISAQIFSGIVEHRGITVKKSQLFVIHFKSDLCGLLSIVSKSYKSELWWWSDLFTGQLCNIKILDFTLVRPFESQFWM